MIRLTAAQIEMAAVTAQHLVETLRKRDQLPASEILNAALGPSHLAPLAPRVNDIPVPRAVVMQCLDQQRDLYLETLKALGIDFDPADGSRDDGTVKPQKVHEFGAYVSLRQLRLAATLARENGETGQLHCSVPREIGPRLPELVTGFVPVDKYGSRVPMKDEAGSVEVWRVLLRD